MGDQTSGRNILLGVTGSIAAYKAPGILRGLQRLGHVVQVVMTGSARQLVTATTFRALSGRPVVTRMFIPDDQADLQHIRLADWADVLAVAPATANFIGKVAGGIADEILSATWMASGCPKLLAPAMNDRMWNAAPVQRNVEYLRGLPDVTIVGPVEGILASGKTAMGHLAPVERIIATIDSL
jgi:phosphopantothenoylcysteine synthetase/decarboxylase